jgi:hypothetical protein
VGPSFIAPIDFGLVVKKIKAILELMHPKKNILDLTISESYFP